MRLAEELEQYDGCMMTWQVDMEKETNGNNSVMEDDCEKETLDRLDIADLLRAEGEMIQRRDTIQFSNLFKEKVEKEEQQQGKTSMPHVIESISNYYECVYSKTFGP